MKLLALLAGAAATYTPSTTMELSTYAPGAAPAITSRLTLQSDQSATRRISARFPPAFTYNPAFAVPGCTPADEQAGTCPEATRIGQMSAASPFGPASGPVHLTTDLRLVGYLRAYAGLAEVRVTGVTQVLDDGSFEIVFDGLPDVPASEGTISLEGGEKAVLVNPLACGEYRVHVRFTSHADETADQRVPIPITGCAAELAVRRVRIAGGWLRWRVSEPSLTHVTLLRRKRATWRELREWRTRKQRVRVGRLGRGEHRFLLRARTADGRVSPARWVTVPTS